MGRIYYKLIKWVKWVCTKLESSPEFSFLIFPFHSRFGGIASYHLECNPGSPSALTQHCCINADGGAPAHKHGAASPSDAEPLMTTLGTSSTNCAQSAQGPLCTETAQGLTGEREAGVGAGQGESGLAIWPQG